MDVPNARPAPPDAAPPIADLPIGLTATGTRRETDSMGAIDVPADRYWGAQTQRSLIHFSIGDDRMPKAVYHAYGYVKKAAAIVNGRAGLLPDWKAGLIGRVAVHPGAFRRQRDRYRRITGNFELNAMRPVIINNFLHSAVILADACGKLREYCIDGTELNRAQIDAYVNKSLMLVTALSPVIGYDKASAIAHRASREGTTLREAAIATGYVTAADFDRIVDPAGMAGEPH